MLEIEQLHACCETFIDATEDKLTVKDVLAVRDYSKNIVLVIWPANQVYLGVTSPKFWK